MARVRKRFVHISFTDSQTPQRDHHGRLILGNSLADELRQFSKI